MGRRKKYTSKFKTKVVLEALKEQTSLKELAAKYEVHQQQISNWKRAFLDEAEGIFEGNVKTAKTEAEEERKRFFIESLAMIPMTERKKMVSKSHSTLSISKQCRYLKIKERNSLRTNLHS